MTSPTETNNEFGFDYLRDNMKFDLRDCVQRGHHFAIVDEVDSILIDEGSHAPDYQRNSRTAHSHVFQRTETFGGEAGQ